MLSNFEGWYEPCKPSEDSLRYHAFIQGMHAGLVGYDHKQHCPYQTGVYRRWWMHGCIVGEQRRADRQRIASLEDALAAAELLTGTPRSIEQLCQQYGMPAALVEGESCLSRTKPIELR